MAEGDEELPEVRDPAGAEGDAAAHGAAGEDDLFEGMVNEYPGSFWSAVDDGLIEEPELLGWNDWQSWRKTDGGLPKGVRDAVVQQREVALYKAAMKKHHGPDYRQKMKEAREAAKALRDRRKESMAVTRRLFPSGAIGSTGSSRVAADSSVLLTRAG